MTAQDLRGPSLDSRRLEKVVADTRGQTKDVLEAPLAWKVTNDITHGQLSEIDTREWRVFAPPEDR